MNRIEKSLLLVACVALPAAANSTFNPKEAACFAAGAVALRIAPTAATPDYRIRIAADAPGADLRMRLVDRPEIADFVLVDDTGAEEPGACGPASRIKTVQLDAKTASPDVIVNLAEGAGSADYTLYVRSAKFTPQDAAALLAAMWKADRRNTVAARDVR